MIAALAWIAALHVPLAGTPPLQAPQASAVQDTTVAGAPVRVLDDTLFLLHGRLGPFGPAERAAAATTRIRRWIAARSAGGADSVRVVETDVGSEILAGDAVLLTVLESDATPLGFPRTIVASQFAEAIAQAEGRRRGQFTLKSLLLGLGYAIVATAVLVALLRLMMIWFPRLYRRIEAQRAQPRLSLRIQQYDLVPARRVVDVLLIIARVFRAALTLLLLYFYVPLVLSFFVWTEGLSRRIVGYALTPVVIAWDAFIAYVPNVFYIIVFVLITRLVLKAMHAIFAAIRTGAITIEGFYPDWAEPTYKIARIFVFALAIVVIFPYLPGASTDAFKGVSLFLGVLLSLGSTAAIGNMIAGIVLTYTRAFRVGDRVRIGETVGDVTDRTLLVTRVRTVKNEEVTLPNGAVLGGVVINYSTLNATGVALMLHTSVTIGYDVNWRQVESLLIEAAKATEDILPTPAPFVLQTKLDDFYVAYELNAATDRPDLTPLMYSRLHANIQDAFARAGVEIMSPHYRASRDGTAPALPSASPSAIPTPSSRA